MTLAVFSAAVGPALSQLQQLPGAAEPGREPRRPLAPPPPVGALEWSVQLPPGAEPPAALKAEKIALKGVRLQGVTAYRAEDLAGLYEKLVGTEITIERFYGIARDIQARYRDDGFILSFSYIPPQTVEDGVFTIAVVEGFVEEVSVGDVDGRLAKTLADVLAPVTRERPLNIRTLERHLLLANDLAGVKVTGVLRPSRTTRGATVLVAKVLRTPFAGGLTIDNRSTEFTGPWGTSLSVTANSPFGTGERFSVTASEASALDEKVAADARYTQPLGLDGLTLDLGLSRSRTHPGFTLTEFGVETTSTEVTADLVYPLIRTRDDTLSVGGGVTYRRSIVKLQHAPFTEDRLSFARASVNYSHAGFLGGTSRIVLGLTQSVPVLNATDPDEDATSRADAHPWFTKANLDIVHSQPLFAGLGLRLSLTAQYARTPGPASEEFSLGGDGFGRAYNAGEVTAEDGFGASAELTYDIVLRDSAVRYLQPYGFYDFGKGYDKFSSASAGLATSLASAGIGIRVGLVHGLNMRLEYAQPLTKQPSNQTDPKHGRVFFFAGWNF